MSKKICRILVVLMVLLTSFSCKQHHPYLISSYLSELSFQSGIGLNDDYLKSLLAWGIIEEDDLNKLDDNLDYAFLKRTINSLVRDDCYLDDSGLLKKKYQDEDEIDEDIALEIINEACKIINNQEFVNEYEYQEKEDVKHQNDLSNLNNGDIVYLEDENAYKKIEYTSSGYILSDPDISEVMERLYISGSELINFEYAEVIPYEEEIKTDYVNNNFELLASKRHNFTSDGFKVSYTIKSSGLDIRITKSKNNGPTLFWDIDLSNIKPSFKWNYEKGNISEAYFKVNYKCTNELGVSTGKYNNYYLDLKDKDSNSFLNFVKYRVNAKDDELEATFPICKIKTTIPNVPFAYFNIDVLVKLYVSGKVEIVLYNAGQIGFEILNNQFRVIHEIEKDSDFVIGSSARTVVGLNFNLEATNFRLCDLEFDGGLRAAVSSTLHLYDEDGIDHEEEVEVAYSILDELAKENKDVRVCGDISLNWVLDASINTSKSILYKYGLTYKKSILDASDQVFGNLTHIENWSFVKKCTRKNRSFNKTSSSSFSSNSKKITLDRYAVVVILGGSYQIPIVSLPSGYSTADLVYFSNDTNVATCANGIISAKSIGSTSIEVKTSDDKYKAYINILVSTG